MKSVIISIFSTFGRPVRPKGTIASIGEAISDKGWYKSCEEGYMHNYDERNYANFSDEQQAAVGECAPLHGNQVAIGHFMKQQGG